MTLQLLKLADIGFNASAGAKERLTNFLSGFCSELKGDAEKVRQQGIALAQALYKDETTTLINDAPPISRAASSRTELTVDEKAELAKGEFPTSLLNDTGYLITEIAPDLKSSLIELFEQDPNIISTLANSLIQLKALPLDSHFALNVADGLAETVNIHSANINFLKIGWEKLQATGSAQNALSTHITYCLKGTAATQHCYDVVTTINNWLKLQELGASKEAS